MTLGKHAALVFAVAVVSACGGGGQGTAVNADPASQTSATPPSTGQDQTTGTTPNAFALTAEANFADGSPSVEQLGLPPARRTFFIDSVQGDDSLAGKHAQRDGQGQGPWKTLARLDREALQPGDHVILACGSVWRETLLVRASGTPDQPIVFRAADGCEVAPVIDGSERLDSSDWSRHSGSVVRQAVAERVLGLFAESGLAEAHHPNRGHDNSRPESVYLPMPADGDVVTAANGGLGSQRLGLADGAALPPGAVLDPGTRLRIRVNAYHLEERRIVALESGFAVLDEVTRYPLKAGWGYFMLGSEWMLDSPGEWHYDDQSRRILLWPHDAARPPEAYAVVRATGIELEARQHIIVHGLSIHRVGTAVQMMSTESVTLSRLDIAQTVGVGVNAAGSRDARILGCTLVKTGSNAIHGGGLKEPPAYRMLARGNLVVGAGVEPGVAANAALPGPNDAAILAGYAANISDNTIIDSAYIGIRVWANSHVAANRIVRPCLLLDDCGGIYTWGGPNDSVIVENIVNNTGQPLDGKPPQARGSSSQGIYLDVSATGVLVERNTVVDADNGVHVHAASSNTLTGNVLYGNRQSGIRVQESRRRADGSAMTRDNDITGNQIAITRTGSVGVHLYSAFPDVQMLARLSGNRYHDRAIPAVARLTDPSGSRVMSLGSWQATGQDAGATGTASDGHAAFRVAGGSIVPNGGLASGLQGWSHWNPSGADGQLTRHACAAGWCATYLSGTSPGLISSPNFSVQGGQTYRLSIDIRMEGLSGSPRLVVRRGGGGANGYESVLDAVVNVPMVAGWQRMTLVFRANRTVIADDPVTGDRGARVDLENIPDGSISVSNLELRPIAPAALSSALIANASPSQTQWQCDAAALGSACGQLVDLDNGSAIHWPLGMAGRQSKILVRNEPELSDSDGDGIADVDDACPRSPAGKPVDGAGCTAAF